MLKSLTGLVILSGFCTSAAETNCLTVTVYLQGGQVPGKDTLGRAEKLAARMFATAGLEIDWRIAASQPSGDGCGLPIVVRISTGDWLLSNPRALAYSLPFGRDVNKITVFWSQLQIVDDRGLASLDILLAHVLVHEITHILQGSSEHAASGVMHQQWTSDDYFRMRHGFLPFTAADIHKLRTGMEYRAAHSPRTTLATNDNPQIPLAVERPSR